MWNLKKKDKLIIKELKQSKLIIKNKHRCRKQTKGESRRINEKFWIDIYILLYI